MTVGGAEADRQEGCEVVETARPGLGVDEVERKEDGGSCASEREVRLGLDARERTWRELI